MTCLTPKAQKELRSQQMVQQVKVHATNLVMSSISSTSMVG